MVTKTFTWSEADWLQGDTFAAMIPFLGVFSQRKRRLWLCAVARQRWQHFPDDLFRRAVETAEQFADSLGDKSANTDLRSVYLNVDTYVKNRYGRYYPGKVTDGEASSRMVVWCCLNPAEVQSIYTYSVFAPPNDALCDITRDVVPNPYRSRVVPEPIRHQRDVADLAQAAYEEREPDTGYLDPARLGILADALEDLGYNYQYLLNHLRGKSLCYQCLGSGQVHGDDLSCLNCGDTGYVAARQRCVRGCWALDAVLGRQ